MTLDPGDVVRCRMVKWGERPHWVYDGRWLGSDEHGDWVGFAAGTRFARPGHEFTCDNDQVGLVPAPVDGVRPWWLATFHGEGGMTLPALDGEPVALYVDVTTPAELDGNVLRAVDLDLDVVQGIHAGVYVDDEDEFAEHQLAYGYPPDVVAAARSSADAVLAAVQAGRTPFDGAAHLPWLSRLRDLPELED